MIDSSDDQHDVYKRLGRLETDVAALSAGIDSMGVTLDRISAKMNQPTNWIGLVTVAVVLLGAMATYIHTQTTPINDALVTLASGQEKSEDIFISHITGEGHAGVFENRRGMAELDIKLQQEIAAVRNQTNQRIELLDQALQREIRLNREVIEEKLSGVILRLGQ